MVASLDHPNVIPLFEAGESGGILFVAMRWVDGSDLRQQLDDQQFFSPELALPIIAQLAAALDAAHAKGLIHRDVKPANVLVEDEHVFLSDFGLARSSAGTDQTTQPDGFMGTADYVAPEVIDGAPADARSDIYGLGCVLYEMLTGSVPFPVDGLLAKLHAQSTKAPRAPSELRSGLARAVDEVLLTALAKDPLDRFGSAAAMADALREALVFPQTKPRGRWSPRWLRGSRAVAAGAVLVAATAGVVIAGLALLNAIPRRPCPERPATPAVRSDK